MKKLLLVPFLLFCVSSVWAVPMMINYQGQIDVAGTPFEGTGYLKFAIVSSDGTITYWSNDGTSIDGSEPDSAVSIDVAAGLYNVGLGNSDLTNMMALNEATFDNTDLFLRIWFDNGTTGSQLLSPDQPITSVGFAMKSALANDADSVDGLEGADLEESAEIDSDIAMHAAVADAHHAKTTSFSELSDTATDDQIPNDITVDYATAAGDADTLDGMDSTAFGDGHSLDAQDGDPEDALVVTNEGTVNIGDTDSTAKLAVAGNITAEPNTVDGSSITLGTPGGDLGVVMNMGDGSGGVARRWDIKIEKNDDSLRIRDTTGGATRLQIDTSGKVGIGTFPSTKLDVAGTVNATTFTGDGSGLTGIDLARVLTNGNDAQEADMVNLGNVGIGTISSNSNLHVVGSFDVGIEGEIEDQDNSGSPQNAVGVTNLWQSFTPSISGLLLKVEINVFGYESTSNFTLSIYDGQGTGGTLLGSEGCSLNGQTGWNTFELTTPIDLTAETEYTMSFSGLPYTAYRITMYDQYPQGTSSLSDPENDFYFRTHMVVLQSILCVDSNNVGMGTSNPNYRLHVDEPVHGYVVQIQNDLNDSSNECHGLRIKAGHDTYNSGQPSNLITFRRPSDTNLGEIQQNGSSSVMYSTSSDTRLKSNIQKSEFGLDNLMNIEVVDYTFTDDPHTIKTGFLAQQLYEHFPEAVNSGGDDPVKDPWMIDYGLLTPLLVKAMQEQQHRIERLEEEIGLKDDAVQDQAEVISDQLDSMSEQKKLNAELMQVIQELRKRIEQIESVVGSR